MGRGVSPTGRGLFLKGDRFPKENGAPGRLVEGGTGRLRPRKDQRPGCSGCGARPKSPDISAAA